MSISRRVFLQRAAQVSVAFAGLAMRPSWALSKIQRFGALLKDKNQLLDLPEGFTYQVLSRLGDVMSDGLRTPGLPDGMAAFPAAEGKTIVVRNHELGAYHFNYGAFKNIEALQAFPAVYDVASNRTPSVGGTSNFIYDPKTHMIEESFLSLTGTERNCAGGATPWGSWISCEETTANQGENPMPRSLRALGDSYETKKDHGYAFEVAALDHVNPMSAKPLRHMGRFQREAIAVDPITGSVYQTEDQMDSLIYRFVPDQPGKLSEKGRLQALCLEPDHQDTRNWMPSQFEKYGQENFGKKSLTVGRACQAHWVDLDDVEAKQGALRVQGQDKRAAVFARGEGIWWGDDSVYWMATAGGPIAASQVFKYTPIRCRGTADQESGSLALFFESTDSEVLSHGDNIVFTPWGDLLICEDTYDRSCRLVGITQAGERYLIAENAYSDSELAGACFSPDGITLFVNIQSDHLTLAIQGPWPKK